MAEVMNNLPYFNAASLTIEGEEVSGTEELDRFSYHTDCAGMRESLDRLREAAELYGEELFPF